MVNRSGLSDEYPGGLAEAREDLCEWLRELR